MTTIKTFPSKKKSPDPQRDTNAGSRRFVMTSRHWIAVSVFGLLFLYVLFYNHMYTNLILRVGKPVFIGELQETEFPMQYFFDKFRAVRYDGQETYQLVGWAFLEDDSSFAENCSKQIILFDKSSRGYVFNSQPVNRDDITRAHKELNRNLGQSGFSANISKNVLPVGFYNVGILCTGKDQETKTVFRTLHYIQRTPNTLQLAREDKLPTDILTSFEMGKILKAGNPIFVGELQETETPMRFFFDKFTSASYDGQEIYHLLGWAFPEDGNIFTENYSKQIVLFDKASQGYVFNSQMVIRKDITHAYEDLHRNLDQSGFSVNITKNNLPIGFYNVGFLYTGKDQETKFMFRTPYYMHNTPEALQLMYKDDLPTGILASFEMDKK